MSENEEFAILLKAYMYIIEERDLMDHGAWHSIRDKIKRRLAQMSGAN